LFNNCVLKDVHLHPDYLLVFQKFSGQKGLYFFYGDEKNYILVPYFKRLVQLHENSSEEEYFDLVSPWYYGGPTHNISDKKLLKEMFSEFQEQLSGYCKNNNIITEFQRFNPLLKNHELYSDLLNVFYNRDIVYVDLSKKLDKIQEEYSRHTRKNIKKAARNNLKIIQDESNEGIKTFIKIYVQSMKKRNAPEFYYFNEDFFLNLFYYFKDNIKLFHVKYKDRIICSSIELGKYGIIHDFLRGTDSDFLEVRPNDILLDEVIKWSKSAGNNYFSIGGGASVSADDSIFRFKKSFSADSTGFYIFKKIHNKELYQKICELSGKKTNELKFQESDFFPEYLEA
ncbi:GNAT family N-acetyltransferase, partial [Bacteroidota bacterium]